MSNQLFNRSTVLFFTLFSLCFSFPHKAQTTLYFQSFDSVADMDTYQLYNGSATAIPFATGVLVYYKRELPSNLITNPQATGFNGKVIACENTDNAGITGFPYIKTSNIDILGYMELNLSITFAAPRSVAGTHYETDDFLKTEYRIDGGSWKTAHYLQGGPDLKFYYDSLSNGITGSGDDILVTEKARTFTQTLIGTGNMLEVQITAASWGTDEEMMFDEIKVVGVAAPGIYENQAGSGIKIFPNPAQNLISINNNTATQIRIYDICGNLILTKDHITEKELQIDISNLNKGVYFVKSGNSTLKFIK